MRLSLLIFSLLLLADRGAGAEEAPPTMDELDLLAAKKEWSQVLIQLPGVSPADRGPKWETLVEKAAIGHLSATAKESPSNAIQIADDLLKNFPQLFRSQEFEREKNRIAVAGFEQCYASPGDREECSRRLREYIRRSRDPVDLTIQAAKMVAKRVGPAYAVGVYSMELSAVSRDRLCTVPELKEAVLAALGSKEKKIAEEAMQVVRDHCFSQLKDTLTSAAKRSPASTKKRICALLSSKKLPCE